MYVGVTSDLISRMYEHQNKLFPNSFTSQYNVDKLVYYAQIDGIENAIAREKQIKGWSREKKFTLITKKNPEFIDLYPYLLAQY